MTGLVEEQRLALEPLRRALLADAHARAERSRGAAEDAGRRAVAAAEEQVAAMLSRSRARGEEEGAALRRADQARARSSARAALLEARREVYERLRERSRAEVRDLLAEPGSRALLATTLRARLGQDAEVDDTGDGGLVARAPDGRVVDGSVATLVDAALATLDLEGLWTRG